MGPSFSPPTTPPAKKPKIAASPTKSPGEGKGKITPEIKKVLLEKVMDLAYKSLDYKSLSLELNIPETALKDQFKPSRANLRKAVIDGMGQQK